MPPATIIPPASARLVIRYESTIVIRFRQAFDAVLADDAIPAVKAVPGIAPNPCFAEPQIPYLRKARRADRFLEKVIDAYSANPDLTRSTFEYYG